MDYLQKRNLIKTESRLNLLGNRLVLVAPADSTVTVEIAPGFPLAKLLGDGRLAMGDPGALALHRHGTVIEEVDREANRGTRRCRVGNGPAFRRIPAREA